MTVTMRATLKIGEDGMFERVLTVPALDTEDRTGDFDRDVAIYTNAYLDLSDATLVEVDDLDTLELLPVHIATLPKVRVFEYVDNDAGDDGVFILWEGVL